MAKYSLFLYSSLFVGKFQRAINQGETQAMSYIFFFWKHMSLCTRVKHVNEVVQVHGKYEGGGQHTKGHSANVHRGRQLASKALILIKTTKSILLLSLTRSELDFWIQVLQ